MWIAVLFMYSAWTGALLDRHPVQEFETKEECYEYVKTKSFSSIQYGCFKLENAPEEYHRS